MVVILGKVFFSFFFFCLECWSVHPSDVDLYTTKEPRTGIDIVYSSPMYTYVALNSVHHDVQSGCYLQ